MKKENQNSVEIPDRKLLVLYPARMDYNKHHGQRVVGYNKFSNPIIGELCVVEDGRDRGVYVLTDRQVLCPIVYYTLITQVMEILEDEMSDNTE